jgi:hypothetical protein
MIGATSAFVDAQVQRTPSRPPDLPLAIDDSTRAMLVSAGRVVLATILETVRDTAPVCVSFADGSKRYRVSPAERAALSDRRRAVVDRTECPETYAGMIALVDSLGRPMHVQPPGYVDPRYVELVLPITWSMFSVIAQVRVTQGTEIDRYECRRSRTASDHPFACRVVERSVS